MSTLPYTCECARACVCVKEEEEGMKRKEPEKSGKLAQLTK